MIYTEPEEAGWMCVVTSWLSTLPEFMGDEHKELLRDLFDWLVEPTLYFQVMASSSHRIASHLIISSHLISPHLIIASHLTALDCQRHDCKEASETIDQTLLISLQRVMQCLQEAFADESIKELPEKESYMLVETSFMFGLVWSIGIAVDGPSRTKFDEFCRDILGGKNVKHPPPPKRKIQNPFPEKNSVYDYVWNVEDKKWVLWKDMIDAKPVIDKDAQFQEIIVPTVDTCRYAYILELLQMRNFPVLFVGPTGTGKSAYTVKKLVQMRDTGGKYYPLTVAFSAQVGALPHSEGDRSQ